MLQVIYGSDGQKVHEKVREVLGCFDGSVVRITDVHTESDVRAYVGGRGMFDAKCAVVFDGVATRKELWEIVLDNAAALAESEDVFVVCESSLDAASKKVLSKHAASVEMFDLPKEKKQSDIFAMANALKRGDKKTLWVEYQRALARGDAPEAIHGVLFWGAKQMALAARPLQGRAAHLLASLAELPHEARRRGFELEYALEKWVLGINTK